MMSAALDMTPRRARGSRMPSRPCIRRWMMLSVNSLRRPDRSMSAWSPTMDSAAHQPYALYLNRFLESKGWLTYKHEVEVDGMATGSGLAAKLRAVASTRVPADWQGKLYRAVPDAVLGSIETKSRFGMSTSTGHSAVSDEMNYAATIRLNLPGRLPSSVPKP